MGETFPPTNKRVQSLTPSSGRPFLDLEYPSLSSWTMALNLPPIFPKPCRKPLGISISYTIPSPQERQNELINPSKTACQTVTIGSSLNTKHMFDDILKTINSVFVICFIIIVAILNCFWSNELSLLYQRHPSILFSLDVFFCVIHLIANAVLYKQLSSAICWQDSRQTFQEFC